VARRPRPDPKVAALRESRTLNPRPQAVRDEQFGSSEFFDARDLVQVKYEMVRRVQIDGASVVHAAAAFGLSRPSYYGAAAALARDGLAGLVAAKPGPRRAHKLTDEVVEHAQQLLRGDASLRPADLVEAIAARFGVRVHPRSVERALTRRRKAATNSKSR
jgi:transposase